MIIQKHSSCCYPFSRYFPKILHHKIALCQGQFPSCHKVMTVAVPPCKLGLKTTPQLALLFVCRAVPEAVLKPSAMQEDPSRDSSDYEPSTGYSTDEGTPLRAAERAWSGQGSQAGSQSDLLSHSTLHTSSQDPHADFKQEGQTLTHPCRPRRLQLSLIRTGGCLTCAAHLP